MGHFDPRAPPTWNCDPLHNPTLGYPSIALIEVGSCHGLYREGGRRIILNIEDRPRILRSARPWTCFRRPLYLLYLLYLPKSGIGAVQNDGAECIIALYVGQGVGESWSRSIFWGRCDAAGDYC